MRFLMMGPTRVIVGVKRWMRQGKLQTFATHEENVPQICFWKQYVLDPQFGSMY